MSMADDFKMRKALSQILRSKREAAGLTQSQLASRLGVRQSFVSKYEANERKIDLVEVVQICRAMDTSLAAILPEIERSMANS